MSEKLNLHKLDTNLSDSFISKTLSILSLKDTVLSLKMLIFLCLEVGSMCDCMVNERDNF